VGNALLAGRSGGLDAAVAHVVTWLGSVYLLGPLFVLLVVVLPWTRLRPWPRAAWFLVVFGVAVLSRIVLQPLVGRERPPTDAVLSDGPGGSFPSGHLVQVVAAAGLLILVYTGRGSAARRTAVVAGTVVAVTVAWSRLALGVHWASDVVAGALLGLSVVALAVLAEPKRG
jgi:undecaprenyl-diphosphatase